MNPRTEPTPQASLQTLMSLFNGIKRSFHHALGDDSPVPPQLLRLLQMCEGQPGITQQQLARQSGRDKGQIARMVRDLLDTGLLQREDHPEDRRSHCLRPTRAGQAAVRRFEQAESLVAEQLFGDMNNRELTQLQQQLSRLRERVAARATNEEAA